MTNAKSSGNFVQAIIFSSFKPGVMWTGSEVLVLDNIDIDDATDAQILRSRRVIEVRIIES